MKNEDRTCFRCTRYIGFTPDIHKIQQKVMGSQGYTVPEARWGRRKGTVTNTWDRVAGKMREHVSKDGSYPIPITRIVCSQCLVEGDKVYDTPMDYRRAPRTGYVGKRN